MRGNGALTFSSLRGVALELLELGRRRSRHARDDVRHELLLQPHVVVGVVQRDFRLDHPELGQMPARLRFLGAERRAEAVDLPERRRRGFAVELTGLREVGVAFVEVLGREQTAALTDRRRQNRRVDARKSRS